MKLEETIRNDMKLAMKSKDKIKTGTLRMLIADLKRKSIDSQKELSDEDILSVIRSAVKSRDDSYKAYVEGNRNDLAEKEKNEMEVLNTYLPDQLSDEETLSIVEKAIQESGAASPRDMGKVMKIILASHGNVVDGKKVSQMVKAKLS